MTAHPAARHCFFPAVGWEEFHAVEAVHRVTVQGRLGERFRATFPGVSIETGHGHTRLLTEPFDQGQLHGLLNRVRDFGFDLLSVEAMPLPPNQLQWPLSREPLRHLNHPG
jgi:hypothetical protein